MRSLIAVSLFAFAFGCGNAEVPAQELAQTEASIRAAEEVGAAGHPEAALHVKMARDQLKSAEKYIDDDETELAKEALYRASLDAELAVALSRENQTRVEALNMQQKAASLRTGAP